MSESIQTEQLDNLPESNIKPRSKFSIVWLVPIIAIAIGSWLVYKGWSEKGPEISITFKTAEGLEAGKTKIKYKNVEIGEVKSIHVNHAADDVKVIAEMVKEISPFLKDKTRFWVVTARVDSSGVSGLGTLLSGAYINVDINSEGKEQRHYTGLEIPPVVTGNTPGKHFMLHSKNLGSIERDAPIYYRKFNVGSVEEVKLNDDGQTVSISIFINAPYDQWVNSSTKFWNSSGVEFSMSAAGFRMNTDSLVSILIGGISFDSDSLGGDIILAEDNTVFELYPSKTDAVKIDFAKGKQFVVKFSESVRGLTVGAPVEFRGIQLGEVIGIKMLFDLDEKKVSIPVTIAIDNSKIHFKGGKGQQHLLNNRKLRTEILLQQGLRAQLETGNLLTGQLYVALDFFPDASPYVIDWNAERPEFPSVHGAFGAIKNNVGSILKKADAMMTQINEFSYKLNHNLEPDLAGSLKQANEMMIQIKELSYKLNHNLAPDLSDTLKQLDKTLAAIEAVLKSDSPLQQDLHITLDEFARAAQSIKALTDYLERHPESLLKGKGK